MAGLFMAVATIVATCSVSVMAQDAGQEQYRPLFTEDMIQRATPPQAERMRAAEAQNRRTFEDRREALRARREAQEAQAGGSPEPPAPRSKIYRWVDSSGRVHFGDAPVDRTAREVKVGGVARVKGSPPPTPGTNKTD